MKNKHKSILKAMTKDIIGIEVHESKKMSKFSPNSVPNRLFT